MKKVKAITVITVAVLGLGAFMVACEKNGEKGGSKSCVCTENYTGESSTFSGEEMAAFSSCSDLENYMNNISGGAVIWSCK